MYQQIIIAGNLGGDPEMRYLPSGDAVTHFSVAAGRQWNDARTGERRKETTWFKVSVFGKQAEPCNQYLSKGKQVLVEGRLQSDPQTGGPRIWTANDGTPRAGYEVRANSVQFLGSRGDTEIRAESAPPRENPGTTAMAPEDLTPPHPEADDVPF